MEDYFTKTFFKFFFGFMVIIGVAFGVIALASSLEPSPDKTNQIVAHPDQY